jgi:hypothetical protein
MQECTNDRVKSAFFQVTNESYAKESGVEDQTTSNQKEEEVVEEIADRSLLQGSPNCQRKEDDYAEDYKRDHYWSCSFEVIDLNQFCLHLEFQPVELKNKYHCEP